MSWPLINCPTRQPLNLFHSLFAFVSDVKWNHFLPKAGFWFQVLYLSQICSANNPKAILLFIAKIFIYKKILKWSTFLCGKNCTNCWPELYTTNKTNCIDCFWEIETGCTWGLTRQVVGGYIVWGKILHRIHRWGILLRY